MINPTDAALLADLIGWARKAWWSGEAPRPVSINEAQLALLEPRLRSTSSANVGGSEPIARPDDPGWLTLTEAAVRYGVPRRTLLDWVRSGKVGSRRIGAGARAPHLIAAADLQALLDPTKEKPPVRSTDSDRLAVLESTVRALLGTVRDLQVVAERVPDAPAPGSPAQRRESADAAQQLLDWDVESRRRRESQEATRARAEAAHWASIMDRIEADAHVTTPQQRLDHLETSRWPDTSELDWARGHPQPETGCCSSCCPNGIHDHSSRTRWSADTLQAKWQQARTAYQEAMTA